MCASIIVALDGSEQSMLALEHARAIAEWFGSKLILVHAVPHTSDLRDSIEYNNLVALWIKSGEEIIVRAQLADAAAVREPGLRWVLAGR